jgi:hypothetical protein
MRSPLEERSAGRREEGVAAESANLAKRSEAET